MPAPLLRQCGAPGCTELTTGARCPAHQRAASRARGSASARGYDARWRRFRRLVAGRMMRLGIAPVCGASLPGGPDVRRLSRCAAAGRLEAEHLELHHEPPLAEHERQDVRAVCCLTRVGFLCRRCHSAVTAGAFATYPRKKSQNGADPWTTAWFCARADEFRKGGVG